MQIIKKIKIYKAKAKFFCKNFLKKISPWNLYSKYAICRNFYIDDQIRYKDFSKTDKFVNLGAGSYFFHPRWDCLDFYKDDMNRVHKNYINWDFTEKKKLPSKYKLAYCSHVIEHIPQKDIYDFLRITFESLKKGAIFRIAVPDADAGYEAYAERKLDFFEILTKSFINIPKGYVFEYALLYLFATPKVRNNRFNKLVGDEIRENFKKYSKEEFLDSLIEGIDKNSETGMDHVNWFNFKKAEKLLKRIGFKEVYRSEFGKSKTPAMRDFPLFDGWLPCISLYIEAIK